MSHRSRAQSPHGTYELVCMVLFLSMHVTSAAAQESPKQPETRYQPEAKKALCVEDVFSPLLAEMRGQKAMRMATTDERGNALEIKAAKMLHGLTGHVDHRLFGGSGKGSRDHRNNFFHFERRFLNKLLF